MLRSTCAFTAALSLLTTLLAGCPDSASTAPGPDCCVLAVPDAAVPPPGLDHGSRAYDARAYDLRARFDWDALELVASEDVTLVVASALPEEAVVELDAAFEILAVHAGNQQLRFAADATSGKLRVDLTPLAPGEQQPVTFTVEYRAPTSDGALIAWSSAVDDPVPAHVLLTDSEPTGGERWLVAKQDPADRALFSVELDVASDEDVVANGHRTGDDGHDGRRVVRYRIDDPLPTYLMAFAAGHLEHTDVVSQGGLPVSLWHRRGFAVDAEEYLGDISANIASFEKLLGPYPWESYAVVLVPVSMGGMENATITFIGEQYARGKYAFQLGAHELGHHWFGDWVTISSFDDLWIKEGMATLLGAEAQRARRDLQNQGRRFGTDFAFRPSEAIVDTTLVGQAKYNSGPYQRAAWLLTQIRSRVGEQAFWAALRGVLADHALGSIDSETFVRSFAPALDPATIEQILAALPETAVPAISYVLTSGTPAGGDVSYRFTLAAPGHQLLAPVDVTVVDTAGVGTSRLLTPGVPLELTIPAGGYLRFDTGDTHPLDVLLQPDALLAQHFMPSAPAALDDFLAASPAQQERALARAPMPPFTPAQLNDFYLQLDSSVARLRSVHLACNAIARLPADDPGVSEWGLPLASLLNRPVQLEFDETYGLCGVALAGQLFAPELPGLIAQLGHTTVARIEYLLSFDYGEVDSLRLLAPLVTQTFSRRLQNLAINRLIDQATGWVYPRVEAHLEEWMVFFRGLLGDAHSLSRAEQVWFPLSYRHDLAALPVLAGLLHRLVLDGVAQSYFVCQAATLGQAPTGGAWIAFQQSAQPWDTLAPEAQTALADPATCSQ